MENQEESKQVADDVNAPGSSRGLANLVLEKPPSAEEVEVMEDKDTAKLAEAATQLSTLAEEFRGRTVRQRRLMLTAVEILLAGHDMLDDDTEEHLEETRKYLAKQVAEEEEQQEEEQQGEDDIGTRAYSETVAYLTGKCEQLLDEYRPDVTRMVVQILLDKLPEKEKEYEAEVARETATNELLNDYVSKMTTEQLVAFVGSLKNNIIYAALAKSA